MRTIAMIMTIAAGLGTFALSAAAENATKEARLRPAPVAQAVMPASASTTTLSGFLANNAGAGKQPAWVVYGSTRQ
ncbi:MAG: hypothetical protein R3D57_15650 [Hyphomicrobiaceae bacterium]